MFTSTRMSPHGSAAVATPSSTRIAPGAAMLATYASHHTTAGNQSLERPGAASGRLVRPSCIPHVQRQCACGASTGIFGDCAECRAKKAASGIGGYKAIDHIAGLLGAVPEGHALALREARAGAGTLCQGTNGNTGCDVSVGTPATTIHQPSLCTRACVERHEAVHAADLGPCCQKANKAYNAAKTDSDKENVQNKFNTWVVNNTDWFECRGYSESARCAKELLDQKCSSEQSQAESGTSLSDEESTPVVSLITIPHESEREASAEGYELATEETSPAVLQDDAVTADTPPCCATLKDYHRISSARRDNICGRGKKTLGPCPFP